MRDGERRAGEVFNTSGAGGSLENQTKSALRISRNIKGRFASNSQHELQTCKPKPRPAIGSPRPAAQTGSRTVVDLAGAPVR
jgi:hypothetical protein